MNTNVVNQPLVPRVQRPRQVHLITDRFSMANTYLIDDGQLIVVDPGSILNVRLLLDYLQDHLHRSPTSIDLIVLTHLHPDHTTGIEALRRCCPAPVAASASTSPSQYKRQIQMVNIWLEDVAGLPQHADWRVIASPGHTPTSLCLYNPFSYELLCGDTVVTVEAGSTLVRARTNHCQWEQTLQTLRSLNVYYLYPGHGRPILSQHALSNLQMA